MPQTQSTTYGLEKYFYVPFQGKPSINKNNKTDNLELQNFSSLYYFACGIYSHKTDLRRFRSQFYKGLNT